ncbi:MAG: hypothetical protein L0338_30875 [Acidobacteria bacterium]|nr:hypothetical protein [Acidobacteriota bacterium]
MNNAELLVSIDIGGTFTDFVVMDGTTGRIRKDHPPGGLLGQWDHAPSVGVHLDSGIGKPESSESCEARSRLEVVLEFKSLNPKTVQANACRCPQPCGR